MATTTSCKPLPHLPPELRLHIISLLPPNEVALSGRLACKDAAQHFSQPPQRTACPSQPLPGHAATAPWCVEGAQAALRELPFFRKLLLLSRAAGSGCEANVELAWQLLQPHVVPELLQTDHYWELLRGHRTTIARLSSSVEVFCFFSRYTINDVGSAAVAAGAVHLLPFLEQRCPGLLDLQGALITAAQHGNLAGLKGTWELLQQRLVGSLEPTHLDVEDRGSRWYRQEWNDSLHDFWVWLLGAAVRSSTPDALAKMEWVMDTGRLQEMGYQPRYHADDALMHVCGAAVSTGDMTRVRWLRERECPGWEYHAPNTILTHECTVPKTVMEHADLAFIQQMGVVQRMEEDREAEERGGDVDPDGYGPGYWPGPRLPLLPPADAEAWRTPVCAVAAAVSDRESVAKLQWLADRGATLQEADDADPINAAACKGNLEAVQFLIEHQRARNGPGQGEQLAAQVAHGLALAVRSGSIPLASWLRQQGAPLEETFFMTAARQGDVPIVRWLLEAGCPRGAGTLGQVAGVWPIGCTADGERLLEAVRLLATAGWPAGGEGEEVGGHPLVLAAYGGQPYSVWCALRELLPAGAREVPRGAATWAAHAGSQATLEALAGLGLLEGVGVEEAADMHANAAANGDRGTVECLLRLGVPLGEGALAAAVRRAAPLPPLRWLEGQGAAMTAVEAQGLLAGMNALAMDIGISGQARADLEAWLRGWLGGGGAAGGGEGGQVAGGNEGAGS